MTQTLPPLTHPNPNGDLLGLAEQDRAKTLDRLEQALRSSAGEAPAELIDGMVALYREVALRRTDADWWLGDVDARIGGIKQLVRDVAGMFTADDKARLKAIASKREAK